MPSKIPTYRPYPTVTKPDGSLTERKRFYGSRRWQAFRASFLRANPLCADCLERDVLTRATIPHHVQERLQRPDLALDPSNMTPMCQSCHSRHHATLRR